MNRAERRLAALLRAVGLLDLGALLAVLLPGEWMAEIHLALGLGELPQAPIVAYLTRSASAVYALHGAVLLLAATDVRRYERLIAVLAYGAIAIGLVLAAIDLFARMPLWWTLVEGPLYVLFGVGALGLRKVGGRRGRAS